MKILVACESSHVLTLTFRLLGHEAFSVDLKDSEIPTPFHIKDDALKIAYSYPWDLMVAHPPCQFLANSGALHRHNPHRLLPTLSALDFAERLWLAPIHKIALENPRSLLATRIGPCHTTYHPWYFGEPYAKFTCLWLKNLNPPRQTHFKRPESFVNRTRHGHDNTPINSERPTNRARTLPKVAEALALAFTA